MSYQLEKNPKPPWAEIPPLRINPLDIPNYFRPQLPDANAATMGQRGRWNSIISLPPNHKERIDPSILNAFDLSGKWEGDFDPDKDKNASKPWYLNRHRLYEQSLKTLRKNPFLPFSLRGLAFVFVIIGLGLACSVFVQTRGYSAAKLGQQPSTIMAIVVLTVALVYLTFSIYDEYFGQPLGLRQSSSKMKFVLADLLLICFMSANLALAFNTTLTSHWVCAWDSTATVCIRQKALVGFIFGSLVLWFITSSISIYRMVYKVIH